MKHRLLVLTLMAVSTLGATAAEGPKSKPAGKMKIVPLLIAMPYKCADADEKAWFSGDDTAFDVDVDYGVGTTGCTAKAIGKPKDPNTPYLHGGPTTGATKKEHFPGVKSVYFSCGGTGGSCWFVVRQAVKSGTTAGAMVPSGPTPVGCNDPEKTIFTSPTPKDVLVRVELPKGCTASVRAGTAAPVTLANSRFVSFSGVTTLKGGCPSPNTHAMEKCEFRVEAW